MIASDIFKPMSSLVNYKDLSTVNARYTECFLQLIQGLGRIGRKSEKEIKNPNILSSRVCFLTSCCKFPTIQNTLIENLKSTYKEIVHYDLNKIERELSKVFREKKTSQLLEFFFSELEEDQYSHIFKYKITNLEDIRYLLLKNMVLLVNNPSFKFPINEFTILIKRLKFLIFSLKICDKLLELHLKKKKTTSSILLRIFNVKRSTNEEQLLIGVIKKNLPKLLIDFNEIVSSSTEEDNDHKFLLKKIVMIFLSQPEIKQFLEKKLNDY